MGIQKVSAQSGFSLVQIMMAAVAIGGLGMMVGSLVNNSARFQKNVTLSSNEMIWAPMRLVMAQPTSCRNTFLNVSFNTTGSVFPTSLQFADVVIEKDKMQGALKVKEIQIKSQGLLDAYHDLSMAPKSLYLAKLTVKFLKPEQSVGAKEIEFSSYVNVVVAGNPAPALSPILECFDEKNPLCSSANLPNVGRNFSGWPSIIVR